MKFNIGKTGWHGQRRSVAMCYGRGFTLIEALIAIVLVGIAIAALLVSNQSLTIANGVGIELSTAEFLIEQIREETVDTVNMPFGTLASTYNSTVKTFSPPHDSRGNTLTAYSAYSQRITGHYVNASDLYTISGSGTHFYRITVEILFNNKVISSASWLRANY